MRYDDIRAGLLSFFPSPALTPGRLNLIRLQNGARAIVDYAHNAAAIEGLLDLVEQIPVKRRVGIVTVPGDRRNEDIREAGRLCAVLDHVIIKEDVDLRGRQPGEIAGLLREGMLAGGLDGDRLEIIRNGAAAIERGIQLVGEDELLIVIAEKVPETLAAVCSHAVAA
jgi:cyanophycin synthetase